MKGIALALDGATYASSAALLRDGELIGDAVVGGPGESGAEINAKIPPIASTASIAGQCRIR